MVALKKSAATPLQEAAPSAAARVKPRAVADGDLGTPNPALEAQLQRLDEFVSEASEPEIGLFSPRIRLVVWLVAAVLPWLAIGVAIRGIISLV